MNLFEIIAMSIRIYATRFLQFGLACLLLVFTSAVSLGVGAAFFLLNLLIALFMGPGGSWIYSPVALALMGVSTLMIFLASAFFLFPSIGAFMHTCAQIGSGKGRISIAGHIEYLYKNMLQFWVLGLIWQGAALLPAVVLAAGGAAAYSISEIITALGVAGAVFVWMVFQFPFWLCFPARILKNTGIAGSLKNSLKLNAENAAASIILLVVLYILLIAPAITLLVYPVYFVFVFAPLAALIATAHYQAAAGMLK